MMVKLNLKNGKQLKTTTIYSGCFFVSILHIV